MKKLLALLLALLMMAPAALAEFDVSPLKNDPNMLTFTPHGTVNTVYRPTNQPFIGQVDEAVDGELVVYVDYIHLVDDDATLLQLTVSTVSYDMPFNADEMRLTAGGKQYTFQVSREVSEYDDVYMEDYAVCLTDASLPLMKAIAQQKKDAPIPVTLFREGETVFFGLAVIPGDEAARLYDRFVDLGGKKQELKKLDALWPCQVEKAP